MNKNSKKKKGMATKLLALMMCCLCLFVALPTAALAVDTNDSLKTEEYTAEEQETELSILMDSQAVSSGDINEIVTVDSLFERLMACETYEELAGAMDAMSEEEYALMAQFSDEQNAALQEKVNELSDYNAAILDQTTTIQAGKSGTVTVTARGNIVNNNNTYPYVTSDITGIAATVETNGNTATVTIHVAPTVNPGTYNNCLTLNYSYENGRRQESGSERITVTVTAADERVKVYVYVGTNVLDENGNKTDYSWADNVEFMELLGISPTTVDGNKYFPVGEIYLDPSYFAGKEDAAATPGSPLITNDVDWNTLLTALGELNTQTLTGSYAVNQGNKVGTYLDKAVGDIGYTWGSQKTALFRWNMSTSYGFEDQTVTYHLDLRFKTNRIIFITGNNGITTGDAADGTVVDNRVYITGSNILEPRNLNIPAGYQFMGYYTDPDFTTPWNGIGTPLNSDQTVYIKITEKENIVLYYKVAQGEGSVSPENEAFNPDTGNPTGSTATAEVNYVFEGWYADEKCEEKLSSDAEYVPTMPEGGWVSGTTYYAKFVPANFELTIQKTVSGNMYDETKKFAFTVTYGETTETFELSKGENKTVTVPVGASVSVSEDPEGYTYSFVSITEGVTKTDTTNGISFTMPAQDVTVVINNEKNVTVDTGILLDTLPYILILCVVAVGAVLLIKKRGNRDDD